MLQQGRHFALDGSGGGSLRTCRLQPGTVMQGGADATKRFYDEIRRGSADPITPKPLLIVNCARRTGEALVQPFGGDEQSSNCILWLPMSEANKVTACKSYLATHGLMMLAVLEADGTVVINCQEGLHRSREMARQLLQRCGRTAPWVLPAMAAAEAPDLNEVASGSDQDESEAEDGLDGAADTDRGGAQQAAAAAGR